MESRIKDRFLMKFKKDNTKKTYSGNIDMFYKFILGKKSFNTDEDLLKNITFDDVEDYFYSLDNEYKKSTINLKIEVLKEFFDYAIIRKVMKFNPTDIVDRFSKNQIKEDKKEKYVPTIEEIDKLLKATYEKKLDARCQEFSGARDRFIIALLCTTGLRIEECLGVDMADIDTMPNNTMMINIHGSRVKNGINKRVPITKGIMKYFYEYEKERNVRNEKFNSSLLFFSINGKKLSGNVVNKSIKELCDIADIKDDITNHCFRHFLTQQLKSTGTNNSMIYKILGWVEKEIDNEYDGKANDKRYDEYKLRVCNILG